MTEIRNELDGEPRNQDIRVYVNAKTDAFCTDLIFPFGIPANGVISLFVGDFSASYSQDRCEHPEVADEVIKQRLVAICRPCQGKPTCVPVPCCGSSEDSVEQSHEATVSPQDLLEPVWKEAKSTTDRLTVSAAHLRLPGTEIDDLPCERDFEDFAVGSPVPSAGDAGACLSRSESPVDPELPHIIDLSAPAFHLFSTSEESEDDSPCVKRRRNSRSRREAAVSSPETASVHEPVGDEDEDVDEFICGICDKSFQARLLCKRHVWGHLRLLARSRSFKCPACTKAFCSSQAQRYHYKTKHMGDHYKENHMCSQCSASFETLTMLSQHVHNVHTACTKVYTCEYCLCFFQKEAVYKTHVAKKHQDGTFEMLSRFPEAELRCSHCPSFITSSDMVLTQHLQSEHPKAKTFGCSMCSLIFQDEKDQEEHEQTWHTVKLDHRGSQIVYICFFCDKRITQLRSLSEHLRLHCGQREKSFLCPTCGAQLSTATTLRVHMMLHEEKSFQCPHCPRQFNMRIYLRKHQWRCHSAELCFSCSHCGKKFLTTRDIQKHLALMHVDDLSPDEMALVSQLKKYPCELCPFVAYDPKSLGVHMSEHPEAHWIKCRKCSRYFKTEAELLVHDARSHKTTFVRRPCQLCRRILHSDASFEEHAQLHANGNGMMCLQCNMLFRTSVELGRHAECHDPAVTKTCGDCGRTFASIKSLQMHRRLMHPAGGKPQLHFRQSCHTSHQCPHCQQHFQSASYLQAHIVYRHNHADSPSVSKLPCPICAKLFSSQVTMSMHLRIHFNEKPYMCELCDKTFNTYGAAKAHSARHLMNNFPCKRCSKKFIQERELSEHVRTTHPEYLKTELSISHDAGQLEVIEEEEPHNTP